MSKFCTSCGKELDAGAVFCTSCGAKNAVTGIPQQQQQQQQQQQHQQQQPQPQQQQGHTSPTPAPMSTPVSYPRPQMGSNMSPVSYPRPKRRIKLVVALVVVAAVLALIGVGIWKAGEMTGLWHRMAVEREFDSWKKQKGIKAEQKEIFEVIGAMQAELQAGDLAGAMIYVHPDCREMLGSRFSANQDKIPLLVSLMNDCELTYLSTDTGNYEALRMAIVQIGVPVKGTSAGSPDSGTARIVMLKLEDGWVVEDIS